MRDMIIKRSVSELQKKGLRFSIDELAKSLKISKKTIYKYFSAKEELAVAIYNDFYADAISRVEGFDSVSDARAVGQMLTVYFQSYCMIRQDIFNKYSLNEGIRLLALDNHNKIRRIIEGHLPEKDREALMIIIDGSLQRLCGSQDYEKIVIDRLVKLIC